MHKQLSISAKSIFLVLMWFWCVTTQAQTPTANAELEAANKAAIAAIEQGPRELVFLDQAVLKLPAGYGFIPQAPAARLMQALGNQTDDGFLGLIVAEKLKGFVSLRFDKAGYIKDEEAKDWNADELLKNLREGTEESNKERSKRGIPAMEVVGWVAPPTYDVKTHHLVWSVATRNTGSATQEGQGINYNTYVLGREGYLFLDLVTDLAIVENEKPAAHELLAAVDFKSGKRYEDFNASTDHVAEYGLAALVGGLAAKKLGLLALIGAFLLKTWKIALVGLLAFGGGLRKFFTGKSKPQSAATNNNNNPQDPPQS